MDCVLSDAAAVLWGKVWHEAKAALGKEALVSLVSHERQGNVLFVFMLVQHCFCLCLGMIKEQSLAFLCHCQK